MKRTIINCDSKEIEIRDFNASEISQNQKDKDDSVANGLKNKDKNNKLNGRNS